MRLLLAFAVGWYFGRKPQAAQQLVSSGQQLLDAATGQPVADAVLPHTTIISPAQTGVCPPGFLYYSGGAAPAQCVDQQTYEQLMSGQAIQ